MFKFLEILTISLDNLSERKVGRRPPIQHPDLTRQHHGTAHTPHSHSSADLRPMDDRLDVTGRPLLTSQPCLGVN
jgi:hypothetical protein